jgi:hypothetical protein
LLYWAKWPLTGKIIVLVIVALPVYFYYQAREAWRDFGLQLRGAWWIICYLPAIATLSWAGSARFGGRNYIKWGWDLAVMALIGFIFFIWGSRSGWSTPAVQQARHEHEQ